MPLISDPKTGAIILLGVALPLLMSAPSYGANYLWEPREQVTDSDHGAVGRVILGPGTPFLQVVVRAWDRDPGEANPNFTGLGIYLEGNRESTNWTTAWSNAELFSWIDGSDTTHVTDIKSVLDTDNDPNVFSEAFDYPPSRYAATLIAHKSRGSSSWTSDSAAVAVVGDSLDSGSGFPGGGTSPHVYFQDADEDSFHISFNYQRAGNEFHKWLSYRRKQANQTSWERLTHVTDKIGDSPPILDPSSVVHFFGRKRTRYADSSTTAPDTAWVYHVYGTPPSHPDSVRWDPTVETMGVYIWPEGETKEPIDLVEELEALDTLVDGSKIHVAWHGWLDDGTKEVYVATLDTGPSGGWTPSLPVPEDSTVSPDDGVPSVKPVLFSAGTTTHLMWNEPSTIAHENYVAQTGDVFHTYTSGAPSNRSSWKPPMQVTTENRTKAQNPSFVASSDSVWLVYESHDDDLSTPLDSNWELWFQQGYEVPETISSGTVTWSGSVYLDRDVKVEAGATLEIQAGTQIFALANEDSGSSGVDEDKVELIVEGRLLVEGTSADPVTFQSFGGNGSSGEWYGIRMDLDGCEWPGYGYAICAEQPSSIEHASVEDADVGIGIENICAPTIKDVEFDDITEDRHIYLDSTDVFFPHGYFTVGDCPFDVSDTTAVALVSWDLTPGTHVVAADASAQDGWAGHSNVVDLFADGKLTAIGSSSKSIFFRPETPDSVNADNWGGLALGEGSGNSKLDRVDIGMAVNPLFLAFPDSVHVTRSRIHTFSDVGLWVYAYGTDEAVVDSCTIERGTAVSGSLGDTAVYLDRSAKFSFIGNEVTLEDELFSVTNGYGVNVVYGKTFCEGPAISGKTLSIVGNRMLGPGYDEPLSRGSFTGLLMDGVCGDTPQNISIEENYIDEWNVAGLFLAQSENIQVECNNILNNDAAVEFEHDEDPSGFGVRFRKNRLDVQDDADVVLRTDNALVLKLGPNTAGETGQGQFRTGEGVNFIFENDAGSSDILNAKENKWFEEGVILTDVDSILARIDTEIADAARVDVDPRETELVGPCWPTTPPVGRSAVRHRPEATAGEGVAGLAEDRSTLPLTTSLGRPWPNPSRGKLAFQLDVAGTDEGHYRMAIYDVQGRRIANILDRPVVPGRYQIYWNGLNDQGNRTAPGVYFARVVGPGYTQARKFTVLR